MFTQVKLPLTYTTGNVAMPPPGGLEARLKKFLQEKVRSIRQGLNDIHENRVVRWRKNYEAIPAEPTKEFPFHNASNLVVPIIAIHCDTLLARVMSAILKQQPPWNVRVAAAQAGNPDLIDASSALETFLQYVAYEPRELELQRVCQEWVGETIRYGTSVVKSPIVHELEDYVVPGDGSGQGSVSYDTRTVYHGPRPEKIRFNDFGIPPKARTIADASFMYHVIHLEREDLQYRAYRGHYHKESVEKILATPDRTTVDTVRKQQEEDSGAKTQSGYGFGEWDIYECWFIFPVDNTHWVKCIVWYHERTNTILRGVFNQYPEDPFIAARLFFRDDAFHGYGFCEMLEPIANEISIMHNQRRDSMTVSTTKFFLVDPDSKINEGYRIFPGALLPGTKEEFEAVEMGAPQEITIDEERLALELGEKRTGVSGPIQGAGAGFNTKRGIYTAMGTLSILQEGNTRTDLNITDIKDAFSRLGRLLCREYNLIGLGDRAAAFGDLSKKIEAALKAMEVGQAIIPVTASTSSVNREVEKQNDIMISGLLGRHYQQITQMLQMAAQYSADPRIPEEARKLVSQYLIKSVNGADFMMKSVMRHFGYDEVDRLVPEAVPPGGGAPPPAAGAASGPAATGGQPGFPIAVGPAPAPSGGPKIPAVIPPGTLQ